MSNQDQSPRITHSPLSSAVWTGLEPATPCVTGRYSNQLNYHTKLSSFRNHSRVRFSQRLIKAAVSFVSAKLSTIF